MKKTLLSFRTGIFLFLLTCVNLLSAQWETHGPYGGAMTSLASSGNINYAGTMSNGVFKSTDGGLTWTAANNGLERTWIDDVATNSAGVFAATAYKGVYFSADQGVTWTARNAGITDLHIETIFTSGNEVYAATPDGVFFSNNNGLTWTLRSNGIPSTYQVYSWAQMGDTIYGGTYGMGLFMTNDDGQTWTQVGSGFPVPVQTGPFVYALAAAGNTIFAGTNLGVYVSTNRGVTWANTGNSFMNSHPARALAVNNGTLYAGTYDQGIWASNDNGQSFSQSMFYPSYPTNQQIKDILGNGSSVVAASHFGMYRSTNNGVSWSEANEGILATDVTAVTSNGQVTFAGTDWTGVYVTANQGMTWTRANNGLQGNFVRAMVSSGSDVYVSILNKKVSKTNNNGAGWTWASSGLPADVEILEADTDQVLGITAASKYVPQKLYQTKDKGLTWQEVPTTAMAGYSALAVRHPYIYLGTANGILLRTSNNGQGWGDISHYMPSVKITAILPLDTVTYVGTEGKGIFMFLKNDSYMIPASLGLTNYNITDIIMQDGVLFASTNGGGVFVSSSGGVTWSPFNEGLNNPFVPQLAGDSMQVFAATDAGVFQTNDQAFPLIKILAGITTNEVENQVRFFPNPSNGAIQFTSESTGNMNINIFNINGSLVYSYKGGSSGSGTIDLTTQPKGIYILKIETGSGLTTKKIVIE